MGEVAGGEVLVLEHCYQPLQERGIDLGHESLVFILSQVIFCLLVLHPLSRS